MRSPIPSSSASYRASDAVSTTSHIRYQAVSSSRPPSSRTWRMERTQRRACSRASSSSSSRDPSAHWSTPMSDSSWGRVMAWCQRRTASSNVGTSGISSGSKGSSGADWSMWKEYRALGAASRTAMRTWLELARASHLGLYEILAVRPDEGFTLRDLWSNAEIRVRERLGTRQLVRWDLVGARVMHHLWLMSVAFPPPLKVQTVEGDPVVFTRVVFAVHDRAAARDALLRHVDIVLSAGRLTLNAMSRERAERGRRLVEQLAGDLVRYRTTRLDPVERLIQRGRAGRAAARRGGPGASLTPPRRARHRPPPSGLSPEVEAEVTREFLDRHYHEWLDQPIPALGNRTPRPAARLKTARPKLIEVLKAMDNRAERDRLEGRVAYDAVWVWEQLGVERG